MNTLGKIIYKTILYTSPIWLLFLAMEYGLSKMENSYSYKIKNFTQIKDSCKVLILGNSEMLKGMNPVYLPQPAFNMAHVSQNFVFDEKILNERIEQMTNLKFVIIGLSYLSFGDDLETSDESWRMAFYRMHYNIKFKQNFDLKDYSYTLRYTPYEALKIMGTGFKTDLVNGIQNNGWMRTNGFDTADISNTMAWQRATMHTKSLKINNISKNIIALKSMLNQLKNKNISVVVLVPPVMKNYYQNLDRQWIERNDSILNTVKVDFNFKMLDFTQPNDSINNLFKNGFNDVNHLNAEGAQILGELIQEYIK